MTVLTIHEQQEIDRARLHRATPSAKPVVCLSSFCSPCPQTTRQWSNARASRLFFKMQRDLRFVFRNFPLTEIHPHALHAALAAEAAASQMPAPTMASSSGVTHNSRESR